MSARGGQRDLLPEATSVVEEASGDHGTEGFILQEAAPLPDFDGNHSICGVWIVAHEACGLAIREDRKTPLPTQRGLRRISNPAATRCLGFRRGVLRINGPSSK
ncbi:MAG: glutathionylspermidine synthase family protein [Verrucomicrobia bacterium]|nr:glutathionylspermidine synthase family protein [Verrucomicrobiota bacterium]